MTIRPTKSTSNKQMVTQTYTNGDHQTAVQKVLDPTCKKGSSDLLKWWPSNSSDHTKSVHPTYMYTNDDHPRPKKVCIRPTNDDHSTHPRYTKSVHPTYIYMSIIQMMTIRPTNDDHPTYKKWTSDLQFSDHPWTTKCVNPTYKKSAHILPLKSTLAWLDFYHVTSVIGPINKKNSASDLQLW